MRLYGQMFPKNIDDMPKEGVLAKSTTILTAYGGTRIQHHGTVKIPCKFKDNETTTTFYVTDAPGNAILGLPTCKKLQLIKLEYKYKYKTPRSQSDHHQQAKPDPEIPRML